MQIVENWTDITGEIEGKPQPGATSGFIELNVKVAQAKDVETFPNLLKDVAGQTITMQVPTTAAQIGITDGDRIKCRVRKAGLNRVYAHPERVSISGNKGGDVEG